MGASTSQGDVARQPLHAFEGAHPLDDPTFTFSWRKLLSFAGPGMLMSIAYVDPGNLEADLQQGYQAGYALGWVIIWSTALGWVVQQLSVRLGVTTKKNLAQQCKAVYPRIPNTILWLMVEIALIGSDIQEVVGSAIAIQLLSNSRVPLWGGVLITGADTFLLLYLERFGARQLELFFGCLVATMTMAMGWMYFHADCPTDEVLKGALLPTLKMEWLPTAMGMIGALVMPHNIYLHSALVQKPREPLITTGDKREAILYNGIESAVSLAITVFINIALMAVFASGFYGDDSINAVGLSTAGRDLGKRFGADMTYIWAIGLLAAGQSSTMTGTYTGQVSMEGFMDINMPMWKRTLITRSVAMVPTIAVAVVYAGSPKMDQLNQLLNVLQSIQLPFALIPVLYVSSRRDIMGDKFVLQSTYRTVVQTISTFLLCLNLLLVVQEMTGGLLSHSPGWVLLLVGIVSVLYTAFVIYLLVGPALVWRLCHGSNSKFVQSIQKLLGHPRRDTYGLGPNTRGMVVAHNMNVSQVLEEFDVPKLEKCPECDKYTIEKIDEEDGKVAEPLL